MDLKLALEMPGETGGIPLIRRLLRSNLHVLGVDVECADDLELALAEACTNVLLHAGVGDRFHVLARVDAGRCVLEVTDRGRGFDPAEVPVRLDWESEHGRGVHLMRALVDELNFEAAPGGGTVARLSKDLTWKPTPQPTPSWARP